jgi:hypothetical protein
MNKKCMRHNTVLSCLLTVLVVAIGAGAQQQTNALMTGMAANAKQLMQYTFKQRTETYHRGGLKNAKIDEVCSGRFHSPAEGKFGRTLSWYAAKRSGTPRARITSNTATMGNGSEKTPAVMPWKPTIGG